MSGCTKYSDFHIDPGVGTFDPTLGIVVLGSIIAARAAQAVIEETQRLDAQERSRAAAFACHKSSYDAELQSALNLVSGSRDKLLPSDAGSLATEIEAIRTNMHAAITYRAAAESMSQIDHFKRRFHLAIHRAEAAGGPVAEGSRGRFNELKARFAALTPPDGDPSGPLDPGAARSVRQAIAEASAALQLGDGPRSESTLQRLDAVVGALETAEAARRGVAAERRMRLDEIGTSISAIVDGLRSDPVVARWHMLEVDELAAEFTGRVANTVEFDVDAIAAELKARADELVTSANKAQIKADQRDYVANSIGSVLEGMGFLVTSPTPEYANHPATAVFVTGASPSGKSIVVSVPIEGQIWYNVEGYVKTVEAAVGGGSAAVCDEAEEVILQMYQALDSEFNVKMGELMWEGKDPNRVLRQAVSKTNPSERGTGR